MNELDTTFTEITKAQRAIITHTQALVASLQKPLRDLGYRLEMIPTPSPTPRQYPCPECARTFRAPQGLGRHRSWWHRAPGKNSEKGLAG